MAATLTLKSFLDKIPTVGKVDTGVLRVHLFRARFVKDTPLNTKIAIKCAIVVAALHGYNNVIETLTPFVGPFFQIEKFVIPLSRLGYEINDPEYLDHRIENAKTYSPVTAAIEGRHMDTLDLLLKLKYPCKFSCGKSIMHLLTRTGDIDSIRTIAANGIDVNRLHYDSSYSFSKHPLEGALFNREEEVALYLLNLGCPYDREDLEMYAAPDIMPGVLEWLREQNEGQIPVTKGALTEDI